MQNKDVDAAILIVDDAKLPCLTLNRALTSVGYHDIRTCHSASEAIELLRQRSADVVLADWRMPEMDGLKMTQRIRSLDTEWGRYTSVVVITAIDSEDAVSIALASGADDFVYKSPDQTELVARVINAARISRLQNTLLQTMQVFANQNSGLVDMSATDPVTGAYVRRFYTDRLQRDLVNVHARGGAVLSILVRIAEAERIYNKYGAEVFESLVVGLHARIQHVVRPIDDIARLDKQTFALKVSYADSKEYHAGSFNRVLKQINQCEIKIEKRYVPVECVMSQCVLIADKHTVVADAAEMIEQAEAALSEAWQTKTIQTTKWKGD